MSHSDRDTVDAAVQLWTCLADRFVREGGLHGPDPGVRWNYRIGRFVKGYLPAFPWKDDLYYLQAQGYWTLANWKLYQLTDETRYRDAAIAACDAVLVRQQTDGAWPYPNPEWRGRIATVEGIWASLGLLESWHVTGERRFRDGAERWSEFLETRIGFQRLPIGTAVNYFANDREEPIPNNTALLLRFRAAQDRTGSREIDQQEISSLLRLLKTAQADSGEIAYQLAPDGNPLRPHFQCFQYNAFIYLDLLEYFALSADEDVRQILINLQRFLTRGVGKDGRSYYACGVRHRAVTYHAAVMAAALSSGIPSGEARNDGLVDRLCRFVLKKQRVDGSFPHSAGDYVLLQDRRSYPRYLAMILFHLTCLSERRSPVVTADRHNVVSV